ISSPSFFITIPPPTRSTLFPYTTLFRSALPIGREARLDHLATLRIEHRRLKGVLMDVDRREQHHGPPHVDEARSSSISTPFRRRDRKSTRLNSSHVAISYAVFCLKKKNQ